MNSRLKVAMFLSIGLVGGCHATSDLALEHSPQSINSLGQLSLPNDTPVYALSSTSGKLVPSGTLEANVDEAGETETVVPIWGYTEFDELGSGQAYGWWQLGDYPPYFFAKMDRPASQVVQPSSHADDPVFPSLTTRACPLLGFDPTGRLTPLSHTAANSVIDVHGLDGDYAQLARQSMTFLSRFCVDMEPLYTGILEEEDEHVLNDTGKCMQRVIAKLPEAQETIEQTGVPYIVFCFDGVNERAWYFGHDSLLGYVGGDGSSLDLRPWRSSVEFTLYNVSPALTVDVLYRSAGPYSGRAILSPSSRSPLMVLDAKAAGKITFTAADSDNGTVYQELQIGINQ